MRLRLSPEGQQVLDAWLDNRNPSEEDRRLVAEVVRTVARDEWRNRWFNYTDISDSSITVIEPRDRLTIHVRLWEADAQFDVMRILGADPPTDDEL